MTTGSAGAGPELGLDPCQRARDQAGQEGSGATGTAGAGSDRRARPDRLTGLRRLGRLAGFRPPRPLVGAATVVAWALAVYSWVGLYRMTDRGAGLGWDLLTTWRAEKVFAHGGAPYSVKAFLYPPSCLLIFRPVSSLSHHQLVVGGLVATLVIAWLSVMVAATALGRRWWGVTAALTIWLLHFTQAMRGELSLENVTVLGALALALCYLFALRNHWVAAGVTIGLSLSVKPLLIVVLLVFVAARQWKALAAAITVPAVLNVLGFLLVTDPGQVWSKLPSLLNRSGSGVDFNSAWVDVARTIGLPGGVSILLRVTTVALAAGAAWLAWKRLEDPRLRIVTATSALLIGSFLAGTLSEYHFMLTLVPFAMSIVILRSPMRSVTAVLGMIWTMGLLTLPPSWMSMNATAGKSAYRAFGMSLLLVTTVVIMLRHRPDPAGRSSAPGAVPAAGAINSPLELIETTPG